MMDVLQSGRMINSVSLEELSKAYIRKIMDLLTMIANTGAVIFDWDGVITAFQYAENRLLPCNDAEVGKYVESGHSLYNPCHITTTMKYIIEECEINMIPYYILTQSMNDAVIADKNKKIFKEFPFIAKSRVFHVYTNGQREGDWRTKGECYYTKNDFLMKLHAEHPDQKFVFVEDTASNILKAEEDEKVKNFIVGYHISNLL